MSSQRAKRKLQIPSDSQEFRSTGLMPNQNDPNPECVSKTLSDIREASFGQDETNCCVINTSQVNEL